ncbi:MAG: hypothetical protein NZ898_07775 [Myxococcota bacterium]|nr:hypothetical protein [Myxococcota bacterium]MDW8361863.1 hypothetical protein [Myxococcales bacterium]
MNTLELKGIDGRQLLGFLSGLGCLSLADAYARKQGHEAPRLAFRRDYTGVLYTTVNDQELPGVLHTELKSFRQHLEEEFAEIKRPGDLKRDVYDKIARPSSSRVVLDLLAGLACVVEEEPVESTLCAANGASQQNLVELMRDILKLVDQDHSKEDHSKAEHIKKALFEPWTYSYRLPKTGEGRQIRDCLGLGNRNPTLRLDPLDLRLYALRFSDPSEVDDFSTELGGQALAIPAFALLPVVPSQQPVTVSASRSKGRQTFGWVLWEEPATLNTVRSLLWAGAGFTTAQKRLRGVFAGFSVDRITVAQGAYAFTPSRGI